MRIKLLALLCALLAIPSFYYLKNNKSEIPSNAQRTPSDDDTKKFEFTSEITVDIVQKAENGSVESLKSGLQKHNLSENDVPNLLHYAARKGNTETTQYLLDLGLDPNGTDNKGLTALHVSVDYPEVVKLLLSNGANPLIRGDRAWVTPAVKAMKPGYGDYDKGRIISARLLKAAELEVASQTKRIINDIENSSVLSIEQFIKSLPVEYRRSFLLAYESRSLHTTSDQHPRVVMFGSINDPIIAFGSNPHGDNYHSLEVIEFNHDTNKFEFREIKFDSQMTQKPKLSQLNPQFCMSCHAKTPTASIRPNWNPYFAWRGFFGSIDDRFLNREGFNRHTRNEKEEQQALIDFIAKGPSKRLKSVDNFSTRFIPEYPTKIDREVQHEANTEITDLIYVLNSIRIAQEVHDSQGHYLLKYLTQGIFLGCLQNPDDWITPEDKKNIASFYDHEKTNYSSYENFLSSSEGFKIVRTLDRLGYSPYTRETQRILGMQNSSYYTEENKPKQKVTIKKVNGIVLGDGDRSILVQLAYLDTFGADYTKSGEVFYSWPPRVSVLDPIPAPNLNNGTLSTDLDDLAYTISLDVDSDLKDYALKEEETCSTLKQKNREKMDSIHFFGNYLVKLSKKKKVKSPQFTFSEFAGRETLILNCAKCHSNSSYDGSIPQYPFTKHLGDLKAYLGSIPAVEMSALIDSVKNETMPPSKKLRPHEKKTLIQFLETFQE